MEWISVKDKLPEGVEEVLIYPAVDFGVDVIHGYYDAEKKSFIVSSYERNWGVVETEYTPTHWMPLPKPPEEEK